MNLLIIFHLLNILDILTTYYNLTYIEGARELNLLYNFFNLTLLQFFAIKVFIAFVFSLLLMFGNKYVYDFVMGMSFIMGIVVINNLIILVWKF